MEYRVIIKIEYKGRTLWPGDPFDDASQKDIKKYLKAGKIAKKIEPKEYVNGNQ